MPQILYDGDFTVAQIAGPPDFIIPFATDPKPYGYKLKYWQFLNYFVEPAFGAPGPLGGGYVGGSPGTFKSIGGGVIEFEREYARVPDTRSEPESFVYSYQIVLTGGGGTTEMPITTHSRVQFDYFATDDSNTIDLPRAPKAFTVAGATYLLNGFHDLILPYPGAPTGTEVLAQDATLKIWKPGIYERQQRFIKWIGLLDLFASAAP